MSRCYALLCVVGAAVPLSRFLPWLLRNGLNVPLFVRLLFANPISSFFAWDVLISAVGVVVWALAERHQGLRGWWAPIVATLCVGGSLGLPLLLLLRSLQAERSGV